MRNIVRGILGIVTVLAALHFVNAVEMRGVPHAFGQCLANPGSE